MDGQRIQRLESAVRHVVERHPAGLGEYELLGELRAAGWAEFERAAPGDALALFRQHFLLFHVLYRLRDTLREERRGELAIGALRIAVEPYTPGEEGVATEDPLRRYYLDLSELERTTEQDVKALLEGFWKGVAAGGEKGAALAVMGLEEPVDFPAIKRRYRQLAMRHHPDRGGDHHRLQELNRAMAVLARCFGR